MSDPIDLLRHSTLQDRLVLDYSTTETVGWVETLLVDVKQGRVEGLLCKNGLMGRQKERVAWSQLETIGVDGLVVRLQNEARPDRLAAAQSCMGLEVWTDAGHQVGQIVDFKFSREQGEIVWYLFSDFSDNDRQDAPVETGLYGLKPDQILSAGRKRIMVAVAAVEQAEVQAEALPKIPPQAPEAIWSAPAQSPQDDWQALMQGAKRLGQTVQQRAQALKDYTQAQFPDLTEQLQDQTQQAGQTVQQRVEDIRHRWQQQHASVDPDPIDTIDLDSFEVWEDD